jgi:hypothetical protein
MPERFSRDVFAREIFAHAYEDGQHVLFAGPTQMAGKSSLAFQLLEHVASPERPVYVLVSKPKDPVTKREMTRLHYRLVKTWPAPRKIQETWDGKPSGYVIWPQFGDIDTDADKASGIFRLLLADRYARGVKDEKGIIMCDDTVVLSKLMGLDRIMTTHIAMAGAMDVGGWYFVQKPTDSGRASVWAYGNSAHKFISHESDTRNRRRYDEISGFDTSLVANIARELDPYEFLYLNNKREMCIVEAS